MTCYFSLRVKIQDVEGSYFVVKGLEAQGRWVDGTFENMKGGNDETCTTTTSTTTTTTTITTIANTTTNTTTLLIMSNLRT